ncbi:hypothetical protein K502DRAFT_340922 [Neoconidiobolus thromboides FSU 785]|nr:hypothetical protein K502DRAFT_340922 [Neoconidiobolus thromboides FSU 785]
MDSIKDYGVNRRDKHFGPLEIYPAVDAIAFIVAILSILSNALLFYITCFRRKFNFAIDSIMVTFIAVFDLIVSVFMFISLIFKWATDNVYTKDQSYWCHMSSILFGSTTFATLTLVALFAVLRYLVIVKGYRIHSMTSVIASIILIGSTWAIFLERSFSSSRLKVNPSGLYCVPQMWGRDWDDRVLAFYLLIITVPSIIMIPLFNSLVAVHYGKIVKEMGRESKIPGIGKLRSNVIKLFIIVFAYTITTLPEFISVIYVVITDGIRYSLLDGIVITLFFSVTLVNSFFTLFLHDDTKRELYDMLGYGMSHFESFKMDRTDSDSEIC